MGQRSHFCFDGGSLIKYWCIYFRNHSFDQLRRLLVGFCFPTGLIKLKNRYKIQAEELIMISLTRLAFPARWSDLYERFPGRKRWFLRSAFNWFFDFMITNWGYLLLNNMEYWKPSLAASCEAIRLKLMNLNWSNWRNMIVMRNMMMIRLIK